MKQNLFASRMLLHSRKPFDDGVPHISLVGLLHSSTVPAMPSCFSDDGHASIPAALRRTEWLATKEGVKVETLQVNLRKDSILHMQADLVHGCRC